ncbi:OLC1v1032752C1 [Oldenlandia corymbosa var. corymbosa]|uniref:OLC1v1032752C1 n=1 Tax=Oldenlandia corymbosa var. corymbosa TaxID=529605 RepID=A0AAV1CMH3_OLDCO|nr:OLC1v1032752C1 [Oldenlandia corymbosa var. corymbosa]
MSDTKSEDHYDNKDQLMDDEDAKCSDPEKKDPSTYEEQEEEALKKKYGGLKPKRPPLISKDQAFFDSADWALGKGIQKSKGPFVALRPKLQPSPHHHIRSRRSTYALEADDEGHEESNDSCTLSDKDQSRNGQSEDVHPDNPSHCEETKLPGEHEYVYTSTKVPFPG